MRKELQIGLLLFGLATAMKYLGILPEFLLGAAFGLALCFEVIGILPDKAYNRLKAVKRSVLKLR